MRADAMVLHSRRYLDQQMVDTVYRHMGISAAANNDAVDEDIADMSGED
jgi:hypothetical protein